VIKVNVEKQSNYPIDVRLLKKRLSDFLKRKGIVSDASISVAIVGEDKMKKLAKTYLKENPVTVHNVLSFPYMESKEKFVYPPGEAMRLGEIALCFPKIKEEAKKENILIDEKVGELVEHGAMHLMGIHHD
jgi:probable rRNA maturation factor